MQTQLAILTVLVLGAPPVLQSRQSQGSQREPVGSVPDGTVPITVGGRIPQGSMILRETPTPTPGFSFTGLTVRADPELRWATKTVMPSTRGFLAAAAVNGRIYALGGFDLVTNFATVEEYDPASDSWSTKAPMPTARRNLMAAAVAGKIYAIGGSTSPSVAFSAVEEYDPILDSWSTKAPMPTPRYNGVACVANGKVYVIGGWNGTMRVPTTEEYDPVMNSWTAKANASSARFLMAGDTVGGKIYVIGGDDGAATALVEEYNPLSNSWAIKAPMLAARGGHAAGVANERIYIFAGHNGNGVGIGQVEIFDPHTNLWASSSQPLPVPRRNLAMASENGRLYSIGGANDLTAFNSVEEYDPGHPLYVHRKN